METQEKNITFTKGDTYKFTIPLENQLNSCYLTCRDGKTIKDELLFQLALNDGIEEEIITEEVETTTLENENEQTITTTTYKYNFKIAPEKTQELEDGTYYYDIQIGIDNDIYTIQKGKLKLTWEVTSISEENNG